MPRTLRVALWAAGLIAAGIVAYGLGALLHREPLAGQALRDPRSVGDLRLVAGDGHPVALSHYRGDVLLVCFGFTRSAAATPLTLQRLAKAYREAGAPPDLKVIMITVDPHHDTPEVVGAWVKHFDPSFIGLTGSEQQITAAAKAFMIGYEPGARAVDHGAVVEVVDRHSRLRYVYGETGIVKLGDDLERLLRDGSF